MKRTILAATLLALSSTVALATDPVTVVWKGGGTLYDLARNPIGSYDLEVRATTVAPGEEAVSVAVRTADGQAWTQSCTMRKGEQRWSKSCSDGEGNGYMFDHGLGQEYFVRADGTAFVTQIIRDGDSSMRLLRTELRDGHEAVRFFAESLERVAP